MTDLPGRDPMLTTSTPRRLRSALALAAVAALLMAGCGGDDDVDGAEGGSASGAIDVIASFYPLQYAAERVGGDLVSVANLTPAGAEPHDLELTPQDTASLQDADLVVYLDGFTPAVDDAIDAVDSQAFDVAAAARLDLEGEDEHDHEGEEEAEADHEDEHDHAGVDPHFWLDPTRLADVADALAARFGEIDTEHAADFTANAATLRAELEALDAEFEAGLASCGSTDLVTSHEAFGYLAQRYGFTQIGISGLSPEEEPSPAALAEVADFVTANDVSTIYTETLIDPAIAETVAAETGATTAVLDPIEGLTDESAGADYIEVMQANLVALRAGQTCT